MGITEDVEVGDRRKLEAAPLLEGKSETGSVSLKLILLSTFVAVLGSFAFGSCVGYSAPVQSAIRRDLNLSVAEFSLFGSILTIGSMIGAIMSGKIADFMGRKRAMGMSAVLSTTGWIAIHFSKGALLLDAGRFLTGYGIGVFSYVLMIVIGASTTFISGTVLSWRFLAIIGVVPCLIHLVGLCFVPESPRWLAKAGYQKEFLCALRRLQGDGADISSEAAEIQDYVQTLEQEPQTKMLDLFQRKYLRSLTIGVALFLFQQFGGCNGIGFYASETFVSSGFSSGSAGLIAFASIQIPITAAGALLTDKCGRRSLLLVSASGTFFGSLLAGMAFLLKEHNLLVEWVPTLVLCGILLYIGSFSIGMGAVPWVIMSEIFPINIKGAAGSLISLVHWFGAWAVSYTFNFLMDWSASGTFLLYTSVCAAAVIFIAKVVPETKGRTLEEIGASMNN